MTNWYAVYTRPHSEKKVAENFLKKKMTSYCPLSWTPRFGNSRKLIQTPLFPSYVFVRLNEKQLFEVKTIDGVVNLAYWLNRPAKVRDVEIEMLQRFLSVHKEIQLEKTPVNTTEMVTLTEGPRLQKEGGLVAVGAVGPRLYLPSLGYRLAAAKSNAQTNFSLQIISNQPDSLVRFS
ncbi:MAG TPA: transcription termination/antitermination NusG family protein [Chitinophagaceae bacterium]|nr:transcription termination/antitermination NusG family protein [Chitinophagaceae bacterium]